MQRNEKDSVRTQADGIANDSNVRRNQSVWRDNGLSLVLAACFLASIVGQIWTGFNAHNVDRALDGRGSIGLAAYLTSGHFVEATFENWESEFLHIFIFVLLTTFLFQRGSAESRDPDDLDPPESNLTEASPYSVRRGGVRRRLYAHSLSIAFFMMFLAAFYIHLWGSARARNDLLRSLGEPTVSTFDYIWTAQFWFESFQNWQSEFLAILAVVVLTIFLRERNSSQSKAVEAPHSHTGT